MLRQLNPILLLVCCFLPGCMAANPTAVSSGSVASDSSDEQELTRDFNLNDPAERQKTLARIDHELMRQIIADTPRGSQVSIVVDFDRQYTGTFLNGGAEGVELMNCIGREAVPGPDGQKQCKTSHVPFQSFKTSSMTRFMVISPPPPDFAAPDISKDTSGVSVAEIVYRDGRRQRLGKPPKPGRSDQGTDSPEKK